MAVQPPSRARERDTERTLGALISWGAVLAAAKRAGIPRRTPHDLRRAVGSWMLERGVRMEVVSRVLGHGSINTTERVYAYLRVDDLRDAVAKLARTAEQSNP